MRCTNPQPNPDKGPADSYLSHHLTPQLLYVKSLTIPTIWANSTVLHIHGDQKNAHLPKCEESDINKGVLLPARRCMSWPDVPHYITCKLAASQGKCVNWVTAVRRGRGCLDLPSSPRISPADSIFSIARNSLLLGTPGRSCNSCPHVAVLSPLTSLSSSGHTRHPLWKNTELKTRRGRSRWLPKNQSKATSCTAASANEV